MGGPTPDLAACVAVVPLTGDISLVRMGSPGAGLADAISFSIVPAEVITVGDVASGVGGGGRPPPAG